MAPFPLATPTKMGHAMVALILALDIWHSATDPSDLPLRSVLKQKRVYVRNFVNASVKVSLLEKIEQE